MPRAGQTEVEGPDVPRIRIPGPAARYRACLLAAVCAAVVGMDANAQIAPANPDPLTPKLATDPRNPPRFQKFTRPELTP